LAASLQQSINNSRISHFFETDGLANNVVYRIEEDNDGGIWLSTNFGLSNFNPNTKTFKNYNMDDGLQSNEFNADASFKSKDGELFFGGINGFNRFFPDKIVGDNQQPKVIFTDMLLSNQSVPVNVVTLSKDNNPQVINSTLDDKYTLAKAIHSTSEITLTHQQNLVTFEFSTLHFSNPKKNQYAYKMQGFDDQWIRTDYKNRRATYTNLPTGNYFLRVKASNPYGIWNETGISLKITVLPPPWFSWWAYSLYSVLLILIIGLFVRSQHKKVLFIEQVNQSLEFKVAERTLGLHQANEKLEKINITDDLTGLNNRRFITNNLKNDIDLVLRKHRNQHSNGVKGDKKEHDESDLIFFLIDLDHFKQVNDVYGHTAGDAVLMQIKSILTKVFRETDYFVRWGGEEFLVVARFTDRKIAPVLAEKLRKSVEMYDFVIGEENIIKKTCSIGYASFPFIKSSPDSLDWEHVLDIADHCLYAAKKSARNSWIGLEDIGCRDENLFVSVTEKTQILINSKQLKVECSLAKQDKIKWN
jgi:diguanylate cyclase (GGDEF)-like protein